MSDCAAPASLPRTARPRLPGRLTRGVRAITGDAWRSWRALVREMGAHPDKILGGPGSKAAPGSEVAFVTRDLHRVSTFLGFAVGLNPLSWKIRGRPGCERVGGPARPGEAWFFLNGISTTRRLGQLNARRISELFGRRVELLHNPTDGMAMDLLEAIAGRDLSFETGIARFVRAHLHARLADPSIRRVVLLAHSQGGVISSNVVPRLRADFSPEQLARLEIYTFGSASVRFEADRWQGRLAPFVEHFANEDDLVAEIGVLDRRRDHAGDVHARPRPGHLLNACYLDDMDAPGAWPGAPRLLGYLGGASP